MLRKAAIALLVVTVGASIASAQEIWSEKMFTDPGIKFWPAGVSHDFGAIPRGTQLFHRFAVKNVFDIPLDISTRVGCNCLTVSPTKKRLESKEEGYIDVTMDASRFAGLRSKPIYITFTGGGGQFYSTATLQISAFSRVDVVLNPGEVNFGVVSQGQATKKEIDVEYAGVLAWKVIDVVKGEDYLEASTKEFNRRPGIGVGYHVTINLKADAPAGSIHQQLLLKTNDPQSPFLPIPIEALVRASLSVVPSNVSMGTLKVGAGTTRKIIVRGEKPFRIKTIDGLGEGLTADIPAASSKVQFVLIKYEPTKRGNFHRQLSIKTDLEQEAPQIVTVDANVEP